MIVQHTRTGSHFAAFGESLMDVAAWLRSSERHWVYDGSISNKRKPEWDLSAGYDGAMRMCRDGWSDGARDLSNLLHAADIKNDKRTVEKWDIAGYEPDVARYLGGDPAHMRRRTRNPDVTRAPVVSIIYNITANANITAKSLALMGSAMVAIVDQLETRGRRVDLCAAFVAGLNGGNRVVTGWRVKSPEDQMDLAAVAFSIAHPAAMRRIAFGMEERSPRHFQQPGYGSSMTILPGELPDTDEDALRVQGLSGGGAPTSVRGAIEMLTMQINTAAGFELVELVK